MFVALMLSAVVHASPLQGSERQQAAIHRCLAVFGEHPFGEEPRFRVLATSVRVMGFGSPEVVDGPTEADELVFIEPSISVMTKTTYKLNNPNGWYCFNTNVGVMSRLIFDAHCGANLADSRSGALVLGGSDTNGGVAVLGNIEVRRHCPDQTGGE